MGAVGFEPTTTCLPVEHFDPSTMHLSESINLPNQIVCFVGQTRKTARLGNRPSKYVQSTQNTTHQAKRGNLARRPQAEADGGHC